MGFGTKTEITGHGLRATARSMPDEERCVPARHTFRNAAK
jgi:hypothetical protein